MTIEKRTMSVNDLARSLGISRGSAYQACKDKEVPVIKIGRRFLIPKEAFEKMLKGE